MSSIPVGSSIPGPASFTSILLWGGGVGTVEAVCGGIEDAVEPPRRGSAGAAGDALGTADELPAHPGNRLARRPDDLWLDHGVGLLLARRLEVDRGSRRRRAFELHRLAARYDDRTVRREKFDDAALRGK